MAKILFINPNKWGRGITHVWIASHSGILKRNNHKVELFDATFYSDWSLNEVKFQTKNKMYKETNYEDYLKFNSNNVLDDLQKKLMNSNQTLFFGLQYHPIFTVRVNTSIYKTVMIYLKI